MESPIPIQNIYYLLCYAWNKLEESEVVNVSSIKSTKLVDLFAKVLAGGTHHLIRRGFDRGYLAFAEETPRIKGKIDFSSSLKKNLLARGQARCEYEELDYNVLHNQILKTTLERLSLADGLDTKLKEEVREVLRWLRQVEPVRLSSQIFRRVQLHRNNRYYSFLLNVCELIYDQLLVDERSGRSRFRDFLHDEDRMNRLFQEFVYNFYKLEQKEFKVAAPRIYWQAASETTEALEYLPVMQTDVCLTSHDRKIILDCKYYRETLQHGQYKRTIYSGHLYQIFSYVKNKESDEGWENCEGILLYPAVNQRLDLSYNLQGHLIRVKTIDLNQDWQKIKGDMLTLIGIKTRL
ncbi:MAG: 5-methylcytosine-specific restriction enzyme subunit McrC [Acidobacteriota bacterium]|nr:5-methylcytosine-specific restriction enzyme subunit McrC [Acidobacteriota bacterium]